MSHLLQRILVELVLPPFGPLFVIWLGLLLVRRRPRLGYGLAALATAGLFVFSLQGTYVLLRAEQAPLETRVAPPYPPADAIVVLGGGRYLDSPEYGGDTASAGTLERLRYAARLQRQTGRPVLVSGGRPGGFGARTEAEIMREILEQEFRVPVAWTEDRSEETRENAAYSARILLAEGIRRVYLVTDVNHAGRAVEEFDAQGLTAVPMPTGLMRTETLSPLSWWLSYHGLTMNRLWLYERLAAIKPF